VDIVIQKCTSCNWLLYLIDSPQSPPSQRDGWLKIFTIELKRYPLVMFELMASPTAKWETRFKRQQFSFVFCFSWLFKSLFPSNVDYFCLFQPVQATNSNIADSFPGMENLSMPIQAVPAAPKAAVQLKKPPKWLRRPCGANFGFGGK
jgi:hypothetical protein